MSMKVGTPYPLTCILSPTWGRGYFLSSLAPLGERAWVRGSFRTNDWRPSLVRLEQV